jgi:hypothetical protein
MSALDAQITVRLALILFALFLVLCGTARLWWAAWRLAKQETCPVCGWWKEASHKHCNSCYVIGAIAVDEAPGAWDNL